jgi:aspartyl-tRNA(Asn)/glutamyl-tRNA(Gln) amidotransferase subunit A
VTRAGAVALEDAPPATADAPVVKRLKAAGAVLVGRTNMTQFAFSVVGLNPHFGTPRNPWDRKRISGGSSSGAAISVADGMAVAAIGSDTVGSIRVPAAICGIVGYKPTQRAVPRDGCVPLSTSLDSIGPFARSVEDCAYVHSVIAGEAPRPLVPARARGLRLVIPQLLMLDGLDDHVAKAFARAVSLLSRAGAQIFEEPCETIAEVHALAPNGVLQPVEALNWHRDLLARRGDFYDPAIRLRIESGHKVAAAHYAHVLERRGRMIAAFDRITAGFDAVIMPTVPIIAPTLEEAERDELAMRARLLRNCAPVNFLDRCAISIPVHEPGEPPVGLMIVGETGGDRRLFEIAAAAQALLSPAQAK